MGCGGTKELHPGVRLAIAYDGIGNDHRADVCRDLAANLRPLGFTSIEVALLPSYALYVDDRPGDGAVVDISGASTPKFPRRTDYQRMCNEVVRAVATLQVKGRPLVSSPARIVCRANDASERLVTARRQA